MDRSVAEAQDTVPQPLRSPCKSSTLVAERCLALSEELLSGPSSWRSYFELNLLGWHWFSAARPVRLGALLGGCLARHDELTGKLPAVGVGSRPSLQSRLPDAIQVLGCDRDLIMWV